MSISHKHYRMTNSVQFSRITVRLCAFLRVISLVKYSAYGITRGYALSKAAVMLQQLPLSPL